ncbi:hypothetical protein HQN59_08865 [Schlegelella sp. ID0723]|uniref:Uncharacterized protein n=1 Tax=Piscinibacter koreensis TaxID=2742824 RepID=A0A7Y6NMG2_9BURK|nr:hypothetical protein [Schlegelella koreensis]
MIPGSDDSSPGVRTRGAAHGLTLVPQTGRRQRSGYRRPRLAFLAAPRRARHQGRPAPLMVARSSYPRLAGWCDG